MSLIVPEGMYIDHKDRNKLNNQRDNLRVVTPSVNNFNKGMQKNNTSGCKGVSFNKQYNEWHVYVTIDGKARHLGCFDTQEEANAAYNRAMYAFELFTKKEETR